MYKDPNTQGIKWVEFKDFTQFTNDSRNLMKDSRPYLPVGYPIEFKSDNGTGIKQRFEQRGSRLTYPEIEERLDKLLEIVQSCIN